MCALARARVVLSQSRSIVYQEIIRVCVKCGLASAGIAAWSPLSTHPGTLHDVCLPLTQASVWIVALLVVAKVEQRCYKRGKHRG